MREAGALARLGVDAPSVLEEAVPLCKEVYDRLGWSYFTSLDRVYDSRKAIRELGWEPRFTFQRALESLRDGQEWRSDLSLRVGVRGYHAETTGVYTTR